MKIFWICTFLLSINLNSFAQDSGRYVFTETRKIELDTAMLPLESFSLSSIPLSHRETKELLFNEDVSLYQSIASTEVEQVQNQVSIQWQMPEFKVYVDTKTKQIVRQENFFGRNFIIESKQVALHYELSGDTMNILGYQCIGAILRDSNNTKIWFSPSLKNGLGPDVYRGYPGSVLRVETDNGKMIIEAVKFESESSDIKKITKPNDGKKISPKEYSKLQEEKLKEMQENAESGQFFIKVN